VTPPQVDGHRMVTADRTGRGSMAPELLFLGLLLFIRVLNLFEGRR